MSVLVYLACCEVLYTSVVCNSYLKQSIGLCICVCVVCYAHDDLLVMFSICFQEQVSKTQELAQVTSSPGVNVNEGKYRKNRNRNK